MLHLRKETGHHPNIFQTSRVWKQFTLQMKLSEIITGLHADKTQVCVHLCAQRIFTFTYCVSSNVHCSQHLTHSDICLKRISNEVFFKLQKRKTHQSISRVNWSLDKEECFSWALIPVLCFTYNQHPGFEKRGQSTWRTSAATWTVWHVKTFSEHLVAEKEIKTTAQRWSEITAWSCTQENRKKIVFLGNMSNLIWTYRSLIWNWLKRYF